MNNKRFEIIHNKEIKLSYGRTGEAAIVWGSKQETWCLETDTSNGEYGSMLISIELVNKKLSEFVLNQL